MGRVNRLNALEPGLEQRAGDFAKAVAAVAHGQPVEGIVRPRFAPAAGDGLTGGSGGEGALKLVRDD